MALKDHPQCKPCFDRHGLKVPAYRVITGTPMCKDCWGGEFYAQPDQVVDRLDIKATLKEINVKLDTIQRRLDMQTERLDAMTKKDPAIYPIDEQPGLLREIEQLVAAHFGYSTGIPTRCRAKEYVMARHIVMYLARECGYSLTAIANAFDFDHSTVMHGLRTVQRRMKDQPEIRDLVGLLRIRVQHCAPVGVKLAPVGDYPAITTKALERHA